MASCQGVLWVRTMFSRFDYVDAARATGAQFVELVSGIKDPEARLRGPHSWTIADCLGHVSDAPRHQLDLIEGDGRWVHRASDLPDFNAKQIANLPTRDVRALTDRLMTDLDTLLDTVCHFGARVPVVPFHGDRRIRSDAALGILIGEFVVHGHDIARTVGARWDIDPQITPMIARGRHQIMPSWVHAPTSADHSATYDIRLRGTEEHYVYEFTDGLLEIDPSEPRGADVHISIDPVTALLIGYGRVSPTWATLTGKVLAWGRRPWLALGFCQRFIPA